ncbi:MAG: hypothetical protein ACAH95_18650 [Fimbriimonas sp.]
MSSRFPYYLLADSQEGLRKEEEITRVTPPTYATQNDIRKGFIYRRVPHVTLKSIANNPDIREGMAQNEIDAAILKHADSESLFDQPYADTNRIRVTGPFTVESLSPHRVLVVEEESSGRQSAEQEDATSFVTMVMDNLKKAGVQNTRKGERLKLEDLQPYAGAWIQATGTTAQGDKVIRVAVSVGPEYGAVSPMQIKEPAKEAMQGLGHDLLVVCGYAFDPHVTEEAKHYGALTVLPARMNADLLMGDELLKKTGAGNLFMVFGEPDIDIMTVEVDGPPDGIFGTKIKVKLNGLDVYDPTTGEIRSNNTDDIACWFIDTNYNGESFFVRHAYFTGADEPYEKLKRALRAEIDESAWASLYSTESRYIDPPSTGQIAIKVINHYGDEVLKVYKV